MHDGVMRPSTHTPKIPGTESEIKGIFAIYSPRVEAGTLNPKPKGRDLQYREHLPRDIWHHGEGEATSNPGNATAPPGFYTEPVWTPLSAPHPNLILSVPPEPRHDLFT